MKFQLSLVILVALGCLSCSAKPATKRNDSKAPLIAENFVKDEFGQFSYNFLTGNGIARTEQGQLKPNADKTANVLVQRVCSAA